MHQHSHGFGHCHSGNKVAASPTQSKVTQYTCPMHPEVIQDHPGQCPKCGMALEPVMPAATAKQLWTCPMHPEIVRDAPGTCPLCGMALEPMLPVPAEETNPELRSMTLRFCVGVVLTAPLVIVAMRAWLMRPWLPLLPTSAWGIIELTLATPVVVWGGWPFFVRAWHSRRCFPRSCACATVCCRCISRPRPSSRCWCCSAKCCSCAHVIRPQRRFVR